MDYQVTHSQISKLPIQSKRVLVRVDFNVPMNGKHIYDDTRIKAVVPTLNFLLSKGAKVILMSHLGRPKNVDPSLSLAPIAKRLSEILKKPVLMASDCIGPEVENMVQNLKSGEVLMLENLRFHQEEEAPTEPFVAKLAKLGDIYINDAFGTAHRSHASTALIARHFPQRKAAGFLMEKEIQALKSLVEAPVHPFHAIMGGAKISTKSGMIQTLKADEIYIGGAMAFPFFLAQGIPMGDFKTTDDDIKIAKQILKSGKSVHLPIDLLIKKDKELRTVLAKDGVMEDWRVGDIGPQTVQIWSKNLVHAKTVFWNGPLGVFEEEVFAKGTTLMAKSLAKLDAKVIIGGGDSVAAIQKLNLSNHFFHLSTGGGAALEFLEFGCLPGIDALS